MIPIALWTTCLPTRPDQNTVNLKDIPALYFLQAAHSFEWFYLMAATLLMLT